MVGKVTTKKDLIDLHFTDPELKMALKRLNQKHIEILIAEINHLIKPENKSV